MLQRMSIMGLGPHREFTAQLNPSGRTLVSGPSESGKSTILEAITLCLWGRSHGGKFRPEAIHDGASAATVEILLDSGRVIKRRITRSRSQQRTIAMGEGEETETFSSEAKFAAALGDLGDDVDALHAVVAPFQWAEMVSGNARAFRDLLTRILPEADVGAEVVRLMDEAGHLLEPGESEEAEKSVMSRRGKARKARDEASGRHAGAEERLGQLLASKPVTDDDASDAAILEAVAAWTTYDRVAGSDGAVAMTREAARLWDERMSTLGPEPVWDTALDGAEAGYQQAHQVVHQATHAYQVAYGQHQTAVAQLQQFQGPDPSTCPTCQRPGWAQGAAYAEQLQQYTAGLQGAFEQATAVWHAANQELQTAMARVEQSREAQMRRRSWQETHRSLGARPEVAEAPDGAPAPPSMPRPDPATAADAEARGQARIAFEGATRQWESDHAAAQAVLEREIVRLDETTREEARLSALLEAIRAAPSAVAERQALALGDLGPVSLHFGDNPAVEVHVDGRPWWLASRGRQVVADMWLRAALRRVLEREWLPIVVDNVQDVGGQVLPDIPGPVILLQTTDGKGISVRRK